MEQVSPTDLDLNLDLEPMLFVYNDMHVSQKRGLGTPCFVYM